MKMVIDVYEYGRGGKCVYMFTYTYAGVRTTSMQIEKEDRHMSRVMRITRALCQRYVLNSQEKNKKNKKVVMNTKPNTNHAALTTQVEIQVEKKGARGGEAQRADAAARHQGRSTSGGPKIGVQYWGLSVLFSSIQGGYQRLR